MSPRILALALLCSSGAAVAEDLVVIDADKASGLAVGGVIADGKSLELPAGAKVLLVGASGKTLSLTGPYSGTPSAGTPKSDGKLMVALASLVKPKTEETGYVGATRDLPWRTTEAEILSLDGRVTPTQCVVERDPKRLQVMLNPNMGRAERVTLMSVETGAAAELNWPTKTPSMPWPPAVPFEDGNTYILDIPQPASQPASLNQFTVKVLPPTAANKVERISQLIESGCTDQARMMVDLIKKNAQ